MPVEPAFQPKAVFQPPGGYGGMVGTPGWEGVGTELVGVLEKGWKLSFQVRFDQEGAPF
jgi:hypothetical protein